MAISRQILGHRISYSIEDGKDVFDVKLLLEEAGTVDDEEITNLKGRPLWWALDSGNLEYVKLLLDHGANPNYRHVGFQLCSHLFEKIGQTEDRSFAREAAILFLKYGSHIPRFVYVSDTPAYLAVREYIERSWTPANHLDWPIAFKRQIVTLLCSFAYGKRARSPQGYVMLFLIQVVAASHFVIL